MDKMNLLTIEEKDVLSSFRVLLSSSLRKLQSSFPPQEYEKLGLMPFFILVDSLYCSCFCCDSRTIIDYSIDKLKGLSQNFTSYLHSGDVNIIKTMCARLIVDVALSDFDISDYYESAYSIFNPKNYKSLSTASTSNSNVDINDFQSCTSASYNCNNDVSSCTSETCSTSVSDTLLFSPNPSTFSNDCTTMDCHEVMCSPSAGTTVHDSISDCTSPLPSTFSSSTSNCLDKCITENVCSTPEKQLFSENCADNQAHLSFNTDPSIQDLNRRPEPESDLSGFHPAKKTCKRKIITDSKCFISENRFNALSDSANPTASEVAFSESKIPLKAKVSPISFLPCDNWRAILTNIDKNLNCTIPRKCSGDLIKIFPDSIDNFNKIKSFLIDNNVKFFFVNPKNLKPRKILLKGLPVDTNSSEIQNALNQYGFTVNRVAQLKCFKTKEPLPNFVCDFLPTADIGSVFNLKSLLGFHIKVVKFVNRRPRQCYRCQGWWHSSDNCSLAQMCLRCSGPHSSKECTITDIINFKCANCGLSGHSANWRGCAHHPDFVKNSKNKSAKSIVTKVDAPPPAPPNPSEFPPLPVTVRSTIPTYIPPSYPLPPHNFTPTYLDTMISQLEKITTLLERIQVLVSDIGLANLASIFNFSSTTNDSAKV